MKVMSCEEKIDAGSEMISDYLKTLSDKITILFDGDHSYRTIYRRTNRGLETIGNVHGSEGTYSMKLMGDPDSIFTGERVKEMIEYFSMYGIELDVELPLF